MRETMTARLATLAGCAGLALALATGTVAAQEGDAAAEEAHHVEKQDWTFAGVFGQYDQQQLQRGLKVYREVCASCHSLNYVPFRTLADPHGPNLTEAEAETIAAEYQVSDISNETGQPFERPAELTDYFPAPFPNAIAAAAANGGVAPPDFSLIAKARAVHRGFPGFITDAFAGYAENGPDYIYALLTGYEDPPEGIETVPGKHYNPVYMNGQWIAMAQPVIDGQVEYPDGSPETVEQYSADISAFLMWAAEPKLEERKEIGFRVMIFLAVLAVMIYLTKQKLWRNVEH